MLTDVQQSTGLRELDLTLRGLIPGDNVVWRVESIEDYKAFVTPYCEHAIRTGRKLIYFRFANHAPLFPPHASVTQYDFDIAEGFEPFLDKLHDAIEASERRAYYVFDLLSDLATAWFSDSMLANFFMLTCPYLYDRGDLAYFALMRAEHSPQALIPIQDTAQVVIDVYKHKEKIYIRPVKTQQRYSPTMHMLHVWDEQALTPVTESYTLAEIQASGTHMALGEVSTPLDIWNRTFRQAQETFAEEEAGAEAVDKELFNRLLNMVVSRDERVLKLARKYFSIEDVMEIGRRMIGTGLIGGKSVGMLLARAILKYADKYWEERLEVHDSFYIASDVFYTFLVRNGCWWIRREQRLPDYPLGGVRQVRRRIITGVFPEEIEEKFMELLDYFGQSPIIVRSSSLLEDNFGNSFAGKYESVFCANQGSPRQRLEDFKSAVKTIYASTMSEEALAYRKRHNLLDLDEQMGLLVQRVSGALHEALFFPHLAGVGFSYNPYVWSDEIDPRAGLMRLVFGLGTRAVDRSDDDYTRIIALNAPDRRPESSREDLRQYAQRKVDVLDLDANQLVTASFEEVAPVSKEIPLDLFTSADTEIARQNRQRGTHRPTPRLLTFKNLIRDTSFVEDIRHMMRTLEDAYDYPVDVEFTANFLNEQDYQIDIVQCRPLQVAGTQVSIKPLEELDKEAILMRTSGPIIGQSRSVDIRRIIYVTPKRYGEMPIGERYGVARAIGKLTRLTAHEEDFPVLLMGPGRWGTTTPSLGVPVSFTEINSVCAMCEIVAMRDDLVPDVSLGTHFFSELVELEILYLALFPNQGDNLLNTDFFEKSKNKLLDLLPEAASYRDVIRVIDVEGETEKQTIRLHADTVKQSAFCYLSENTNPKA